MRSITYSVIAAALLAATAANAQVTVEDAWVRATVPQQKVTGAFMQLQATKDSKLVAAKSPAAPEVQMHEMAMQDNIMKMRQVPSIALPAGTTVELKPGSYHLMLIDLPQQIKEGEIVPLTLVFEDKDGKRESVEINATARPLNSSGSAAHGTPELLKAYLANFDPSFLALRPSLEQLAALAKDFKVYYKKSEGKPPSSYTMEHSAGSFVYDTHGQLRLLTRYGSGAQPLASDFKLLLKDA